VVAASGTNVGPTISFSGEFGMAAGGSSGFVDSVKLNSDKLLTGEIEGEVGLLARLDGGTMSEGVIVVPSMPSLS